jgi:hypothetical protein
MAMVKFNRGASLLELGRLDEARPLLLAGSEGAATVFGEPHPRLAGTFSVLARFHIETGEFEAAEAALARASKSSVGEDERAASLQTKNLSVHAQLAKARGHCAKGLRKLEANRWLEDDAPPVSRAEALLALAEGVQACDAEDPRAKELAAQAGALVDQLDPPDPVLARWVAKFSE